MSRPRPPLRCYHTGCGRFAPTPEGWSDETVLVAFPECTPCRKLRELRDRRAEQLERNLAKAYI